MAVCCEGDRNYTAPAKVYLSPNINPLYVCDIIKGQGGNFTNNLIKTNPQVHGSTYMFYTGAVVIYVLL
jgi:hypothetical protein